MTPQEKINQLAVAALRSAPPTGSAPEPATYMAPFGTPRSKEENKAPAKLEVLPDSPEVEKETNLGEYAEAEAKPFVDQVDPELRAMIENRDVRIAKSIKRRSLALTMSVLAMLGGGGWWYSVSPTAQASVAKLIPALRQSVDDVKMIGSMTSQYDDSLEQISVHGGRIDDATAALGIDPTSVSDEENMELENEMREMMGDGAVTVGDRNKALQDKFGVVGKLMGKKEGQETSNVNP